jgi:hypothetical protein
MKIYLAGSFAHRGYVRNLAEKIRFYGHEVYCFCDPQEETYMLSMKIREQPTSQTFTPATALLDPNVVLLGLKNWKKLAKIDAVIVALPCGKSAHLEAGWAKGRGKKVYVYGVLPVGEWDAMYVMVDAVFDEHEFDKMMDAMI